MLIRHAIGEALLLAADVLDASAAGIRTAATHLATGSTEVPDPLDGDDEEIVGGPTREPVVSAASRAMLSDGDEILRAPIITQRERPLAGSLRERLEKQGKI